MSDDGKTTDEGLALYRDQRDEHLDLFCNTYRAWIHALYESRLTEGYGSYISRRNASQNLDAKWREYCAVRDLWFGLKPIQTYRRQDSFN